MTNAWRVSEVTTDRPIPSPLVGEGGARAAPPRGRVRGNADGLTKRQRLPPETVIRSRALRQQAGEPERRLWRALRETFPSARFRRQVPIGPYHVDFCSHGGRLIVEVDGDDHASRTEQDANRTRFLRSEGYDVIRIGNTDVMTNIDGVLAFISDAVAYKERGHP